MIWLSIWLILVEIIANISTSGRLNPSKNNNNNYNRTNVNYQSVMQVIKVSYILQQVHKIAQQLMDCKTNLYNHLGTVST
jgi:hypothetical protein